MELQAFLRPMNYLSKSLPATGEKGKHLNRLNGHRTVATLTYLTKKRH